MHACMREKRLAFRGRPSKMTFWTEKLLKEWIRENIGYLIILALSLYTLSWFQDELLVMGGDLIPPTNPMYGYQNLWTWHVADCGLPNVILARLFFPVYLVPMTFMLMGFNIWQAQRLYVVVMYFLSGSSMYFLALQMETNPRLNKRVLAFFSALFYMFNPYLLSSGAHSSILLFSVYGLTPLILALCIEGLKKGKLRYAVFMGILSSIITSTFPGYKYTLLMGLLLISYTIYHVIVEKDAAKTGIFLFTFLGVSILINLWWLLPSLQNLSIYLSTIADILVRSKAKWTTLTEVLRFLGYWGFYSGYRGLPYYPYASAYVSNPLLITLTFMLPLMAFSAILMDRKDRSVWFFTFLALISLFLAKGENPPGGGLFSWLLTNLPFLRALRDPYHFIRITVIAYSFLMGVTCASLHYFSQRRGVTASFRFKSTKISISTRTIGRYVVPLILVSLILISSWPLVTGDVVTNWYDSPRRGVKIPSEYHEVEEWFKSQEEDFRVFVLPQRGTYIAYKWGYQGADILSHLFSKPLISGVGTQYVQSPSHETIEAVYRSFYENQTHYIGRVLGLMGVKYILVETAIDTEFYGLPPVSRDIRLLESQMGIKMVKAYENLLIYENEFFHPLVYASASVRLINGSIESPADVGWRDDNFRTGWDLRDWGAEPRNLSTDGEIAYRTLASEGSYVASAMTKMVSIDPNEYPYLLIRFKSNQYSSVCVALRTTQGDVYLHSINPTKNRFMNQYKSTEWYTLAYRATDATMYPITSIILFITNRQHETYMGKLELWLDYVLWAKSIGTLDEAVKAIEDGSAAIVIVRQNAEKESTLRSFSEEYKKFDPPQLLFERINPTECVVHVKEATSPFLLIFGESYDTQWKAYIGGTEIKEHLIVNGYANGWFISKSGNYDVLLKFEPQKWFYYGSTISITTLLGSVAYLTWDWNKKSYDGSTLQRSISRLRKRLKDACTGSKHKFLLLAFAISPTVRIVPEILTEPYLITFKSQIPHILVVIFIFLSHFVFKSQDLPTLLFFIALIPIFTYFKFDARIPVGYAILMLILAATALALYKNEALANQLSIYAYWLLVVGVTCLTMEYVREQRKSEK